jgi:AcrR family transcriptional regulator
MTEAESGSGSGESRSQDSRDEILKAATDLFATRGFHETSMAEVARVAGVSKALIFWHFKSKSLLRFSAGCLNRMSSISLKKPAPWTKRLNC